MTKEENKKELQEQSKIGTNLNFLYHAYKTGGQEGIKEALKIIHKVK